MKVAYIMTVWTNLLDSGHPCHQSGNWSKDMSAWKIAKTDELRERDHPKTHYMCPRGLCVPPFPEADLHRCCVDLSRNLPDEQIRTVIIWWCPHHPEP